MKPLVVAIALIAAAITLWVALGPKGVQPANAPQQVKR